MSNCIIGRDDIVCMRVHLSAEQCQVLATSLQPVADEQEDQGEEGSYEILKAFIELLQTKQSKARANGCGDAAMQVSGFVIYGAIFEVLCIDAALHEALQGMSNGKEWDAARIIVLSFRGAINDALVRFSHR